MNNTKKEKKILRYMKRKNGETCIMGKSFLALGTIKYNGISQEKNISRLAMLLAKEVGCYGFCDLNSPGIVKEEVSVFIFFKSVEMPNESLVELYDGSSNPEYKFLNNVIKCSLEYLFRNEKNKNVVSIVSSNQYPDVIKENVNTQNSNKIVLSLGINKEYVNPNYMTEFLNLFNALKETFGMISNIDWNAKKKEVYKLGSSNIFKPQDIIILDEDVENDGSPKFQKNSLLNICTYGYELEKVRLHGIDELKERERNKILQTKNESSDIGHVYLSNRLIEVLFDRGWIEDDEIEPGLKDVPIIIYENERAFYPIGMPKANKIDRIFFSSMLYTNRSKESKLFDYIVFNRYTDSRLYIDYLKSDYKDNGRVKKEGGEQPAEKIMIPRYYKKLLGFVDKPLKLIRCEEFEKILLNFPSDSEEYKNLNECYEKIEGEIFYRLKEKYQSEDLQDCDCSLVKSVTEIQEGLNIFKEVDLLRVPKEVKKKESVIKRLRHLLGIIVNGLLNVMIGKSEFLLKTEWTSDTDDRYDIARISPNMMSLLGISENDKIIIQFGRKKEVLRVLMKEGLSDYEIGIPAPSRKKLGMNSINDIVVVHRDMGHIFLRHSEEQMIALLGTILAVVQVVDGVILRIVLCVLITIALIWFVLNEERVKVK